MKCRAKIALFSNVCHFEIWFPKKKTVTFCWSKLSKLHKKRHNFACDNYIFTKTRGNKNKQWIHSTPLKILDRTPYLQSLIYHYLLHKQYIPLFILSSVGDVIGSVCRSFSSTYVFHIGHQQILGDINILHCLQHRFHHSNMCDNYWNNLAHISD